MQELFPILLTVGKYFCAARPPLLLPAFFCAIISAHPPVAKLDIAADSDSEGRGFESSGRARKEVTFVYQSYFFFIQAAGCISSRVSVYIIAVGAYHQPRLYHFRNNNMQRTKEMPHKTTIKISNTKKIIDRSRNLRYDINNKSKELMKWSGMW